MGLGLGLGLVVSMEKHWPVQEIVMGSCKHGRGGRRKIG